MKLLLEEVVVLLGGGAVVMQPGGQITEWMTMTAYKPSACSQIPAAS